MDIIWLIGLKLFKLLVTLFGAVFGIFLGLVKYIFASKVVFGWSSYLLQTYTGKNMSYLVFTFVYRELFLLCCLLFLFLSSLFSLCLPLYMDKIGNKIAPLYVAVSPRVLLLPRNYIPDWMHWSSYTHGCNIFRVQGVVFHL